MIGKTAYDSHSEPRDIAPKHSGETFTPALGAEQSQLTNMIILRDRYTQLTVIAKEALGQFHGTDRHGERGGMILYLDDREKPKTVTLSILPHHSSSPHKHWMCPANLRSRSIPP